VTVKPGSGGGERTVEVASGTAVWDHPGKRVPIRWVLVRDTAGAFEPQALVCTDLAADPADILGWFVRRWAVEVTFAEVRRHLGVETQRQWSDKAIARTTPALMGLFSLVTLWGGEVLATSRPRRPPGMPSPSQPSATRSRQSGANCGGRLILRPHGSTATLCKSRAASSTALPTPRASQHENGQSRA
jgi:hypothetical protein